MNVLLAAAAGTLFAIGTYLVIQRKLSRIIIGISLMRVGVGWALGGPAHLAQSVDVPKLVQMVDGAKARAAEALAARALPPLKPNQPNQRRAAPRRVKGTLWGRMACRP